MSQFSSELRRAIAANRDAILRAFSTPQIMTAGGAIVAAPEAGPFEGRSRDIGMAAGTVRGIRMWTASVDSVADSDFNGPCVLYGATIRPWKAGPAAAGCNRHGSGLPEELPRGHRPPEDGCGCVSPETRVLTADLRWVPAGDLAVGEHLMAFDEYPADRGYQRAAGRKYRDAVVASADRGKLPCYDLRFEDGTKVRVSADHRWLAYSGQKGAHWVRTDELRAGELRASHIVKPFTPWKAGVSREAGYLAAAFDGEGCLFQRGPRYQFRLDFTQAGNPMLAETERCLKELGFQVRHQVRPRSHATPRADGTPRLDVYRLTLTARPEIMRFLGEVRPVRLLPKFQPGLLGRVNMANRPRLIGKSYAGEREVVMLGTTAGTYFAEGLASHNCGFWAYWEWNGEQPVSSGAGRVPVAGVIEGWGRVKMGSKGFRCEKAKIIALAPAFILDVIPDADPWTGRNWVIPEETRREAQIAAAAWMGKFQAWLGAHYPDAEICATMKGMLATCLTGEFGADGARLPLVSQANYAVRVSCGIITSWTACTGRERQGGRVPGWRSTPAC